MKDGETVRVDCNDCNTEFEVTLEPKSKDAKGHKPGKNKIVNHCPFCGSEEVQGPDEEDDDG